MKTISLALFGAVLISSGAVFAQPLPGMPATGAPPAAGPASGPRNPGGLMRLFDANGDGQILWDEAWIGVQQRFTAMDRNNDGAVTLEEALAARPARRPDAPQQPNGQPPRPDQSQRVGMMFRSLDANQDGRVTLDEVRPAAEARFRALDANGDRVVSTDELPRHRHHGPRGHGAPGGGQRPAQPG